jgi:hypothetical protein
MITVTDGIIMLRWFAVEFFSFVCCGFSTLFLVQERLNWMLRLGSEMP